MPPIDGSVGATFGGRPRLGSGVVPPSTLLREPTAGELVFARGLRGQLPLLTRVDLLPLLLSSVLAGCFAVMSWRTPVEGQLPQPWFVVWMVLMLLSNPVQWPWPMARPTMPRLVLPLALVSAVVAWVADCSSWGPAPGDRFFRAVGVGVAVAALGILVRIITGWMTLPRSASAQVLTSSPGLAILLALDGVAEARSARIAESLAMPVDTARGWLGHLCGLALVANSSKDRYRITPTGRRLLEDHLNSSA